MAARWLRRLALGLLLSMLSLVGAQDESDKTRADDEPSETPAEKVQAVLDIGGHSGTIQDLLFGKDGKLYTCGVPGDLYEWDVESGERLRVWRFPEAARRLALSPDGKQLAVGGNHRPPGADGKIRVSVWLVNLKTGEARVQATLEGDAVTRLAFSPDGKTLAVNHRMITTLLDLAEKPEPPKVFQTGHLVSLAFNPNLKRLHPLLLAVRPLGSEAKRAPVRLFDLAPGSSNRPELLSKAGGERSLADWSPQGTGLVCIRGGPAPSFQFWKFSDTAVRPPLAWELDKDQLLPLLAEKKKGKAVINSEAWHTMGVVFRSENEVVACWEQDSRVRILRFDLANQKVELLPGNISRQRHFQGLALHPEGKLLAMAGNPNNRIVIYDLDKGKPRMYRNPESARNGPVPMFGPMLFRPRFVGWTGAGHGLLWGYGAAKNKEPEKHLKHGLNPQTMKWIRPKGRVLSPEGNLPADWKLELDDSRQLVLVRPDRKVRIDLPKVDAGLVRAFKDAQDQDRLLVPCREATVLAIVDPDTGKVVRWFGKKFFPIYDLAVSPDHKYLLVAGGNLTLDVYPLARPTQAILHVVAFKGDWVAWTPEGYYAGTPGGERWLGWKVVRDEDQLATFYPVQAFKRTFYRPDVIQNLLAASSVQAALAKTGKDIVARDIQTVQPPSVKITAADQDPRDKGKWIIKARAQFASDQKVEKMRLLIDGRPLSEEEVKPQYKQEGNQLLAEWIIPKMTEGEQVELKVLARCSDVSSISPPRRIDTLPPEKKPVLHLVCVGLNYGNGHPAPQLSCAQNDAQAIARAFAATCAGGSPLFGQANSHLLLGPQATTSNIRDELQKVRKEVKPRDLLVFFFAGHGVREKQQFYLITQDARLNNLARTALSGEHLRQAFTDCPCQVLVLLDACHSATAGLFLGKRGLRSATDEAARDLADEECAAALLAAALGNEQAKEPKLGNGLFTQALLRALQGEKGNVLYNRFDGRQYVHHLFTEVLDQVQHESQDEQHPFLSLPWTVESFPVRMVR